MNKLYEKIKLINTITIFLFLIVGIVITAFSVFSMFWGRKKFDNQGVNIVNNIDRKLESKEVQIYEFSKKIKDTYIFRKLNDAITEDELLKIKTNNSKLFYSGYFKNENIINLIFINHEKNIKKNLFPNDVYIYNIRFSEFPKGIKDKFYREFEHQYNLEYNLYQVVEEDSNKDKKLTRYDNIKLYKSDYNGENLLLVNDNIVDYQIISDNKIIYKTADNNSLNFYEYDLKNNKQIKLFGENLF